MKVVDAQGHIQGHFASKPVPVHGIWMVAQGTVQVATLHN